MSQNHNKGTGKVPLHYVSGQYECRLIVEAYGLGFNIGNVLKYILRAEKKTENPIEDYQKAIDYLCFEIDRLQRQQKDHPNGKNSKEEEYPRSSVRSEGGPEKGGYFTKTGD